MNRDETLHICLELISRAGASRAAGSLPSRADLTPLAQALWPDQGEAALQALCDPYLAATMLWRTLAEGFRGNPNHLRPLDCDGPRLARDLLALLNLHQRIRFALPGLVDWPEGGQPAHELVGDGGWCDLCGQCCCHCGTVPTAPPGVSYPAWFYHALAGETVHPQPYCPFLFQALEEPLFFCGLHPIKPLACIRFDRADCARGRPGRGRMPGREQGNVA
jgi:hypothetical protein